MNTPSMQDPWGTTQAGMLHPWEYTTMDPSSSTSAQYNGPYMSATDFYSSLGNSNDGVPSSSGISNQSSSKGKEPTSTNDTAQENKNLQGKVNRRREQNRSAQRAFRDRKDRHQRELEHRLVEMREKHQVLVRSYSEQQKQVQRLKARFEALNTIITTLKEGSPDPCGTSGPPPAFSDPSRALRPAQG